MTPNRKALTGRQKLNVSALQQMTAPITVRVDRIGPTGRSPVPLERLREDLPSGAGWTPEAVLDLDGRLLLDYAGGGNYEISATDALGTSVEWMVSYDPRTFPPKVPSALVSDGVAMSDPTPPPSNGMSTPMGYAVEGTMPMSQAQPMFQPNYPAPNYPQPQFTPQQVPQMRQPTPSYFGWNQWPPTPTTAPATPIAGASPAEQERIRLAHESEALKAKLADMERRALEERYAQQLAAQKTDADRKLEELKAEIARAAQTANSTSVSDAVAKTLNEGLRAIADLVSKQPAPPSGPSPELLAMQAQLAQMQDQTRRSQEENQRIRDQAEARERERAAEERHRQDLAAMKDLMRSEGERTQRLIDEMKAAALANRGPDPAITMMQENLRMIMSQQENAIRQVAANNLNPLQLMQLVKDNNNGTDALTRNIAGAYGDMFTMFREGIQNVMQLAPQGDSPVIRVIEGAIERASSMAGKYVEGQRDQGMAQAQVAKAQAQAQADIAKAQAQVFEAQQRPAVGAPGSVRSDGVRTGAPGTVQPELPQPAAPITDPGVSGMDTTPKRLGKTDHQWFGGVYDHVMNLRANVALYLQSTATNPPARDADGNIPGLHPTQTAKAILVAAAELQKQQADVPVFRLFASDQYADMFDVLLPDAPQTYRDECVRVITRTMDPAASMFPQGPAPGPAAPSQAIEDDDSETEYEDDGEEEDPPPPPPRARPSANGAKSRASS